MQSFVTVNSTVEKSLSLNVEVAGMISINLAIFARCGNRNSFCFHQSNGLEFLGATLSVKYRLNSSSVFESPQSFSRAPNSVSRTDLWHLGEQVEVTWTCGIVARTTSLALTVDL